MEPKISASKREVIERIQKMSDEEFRSWYNAVDNEMLFETVICNDCRGHGEINLYVYEPYRNYVDPNHQSYSFKSRKCTSCNGTGKVRRRKT